MEEKLRNLSQNIANNTGPREANEPEDRHEDHFEEDDSREYQDEHNNERIDMDSSYADDIQDAEEPEESHDEEKSAPVEEQEEPGDDAYPEESHGEEHKEEHSEPEPSEEDLADIDSESEEPHEEEPVDENDEDHGTEADQPSKAAILTMDNEEEQSSEPSSYNAKYSPEVEAALSRLNPEESSEEMSEPLSTEPHKKKHHAGPIFLFILFVLAVAAVSICILVEQKIIENPFPNLFKKSEPTSEVQPKEDTPSEPVQEHIVVNEWGIKILQPEGVSTFWYDTVEDSANRIRVYGADEDYIPDATTSQGANVVAEVIRSTESTFQYNEDITLSPTTSLSGYYYYMVIIYGDIEDELFQVFQDELLDNETAILAL